MTSSTVLFVARRQVLSAADSRSVHLFVTWGGMMISKETSAWTIYRPTRVSHRLCLTSSLLQVKRVCFCIGCYLCSCHGSKPKPTEKTFQRGEEKKELAVWRANRLCTEPACFCDWSLTVSFTTGQRCSNVPLLLQLQLPMKSGCKCWNRRSVQ